MPHIFLNFLQVFIVSDHVFSIINKSAKTCLSFFHKPSIPWLNFQITYIQIHTEAIFYSFNFAIELFLFHVQEVNKDFERTMSDMSGTFTETVQNYFTQVIM